MTAPTRTDKVRNRNIRPRLSATLLIADVSGAEPRFLFGKRHERHRFMPGTYVFPGGRIDKADHHPAHLNLPQNPDAGLIAKAYGRRATRLSLAAPAICALREAHEETGILIGCDPGGTCDLPGFAEHGLQPNLPALRLLARATTPPTYPIRYEAYFFMTFRTAITVAETDFGPDSELSGLVWASADETTAMKLPVITRWILEVALERLRDDPGLDGAVPVPDFYTRAGQHHKRMLQP